MLDGELQLIAKEGLAQTERWVLRPARVLGERVGLLEDVAAASYWIHAKLLTTAGCC